MVKKQPFFVCSTYFVRISQSLFFAWGSYKIQTHQKQDIYQNPQRRQYDAVCVFYVCPRTTIGLPRGLDAGGGGGPPDRPRRFGWNNADEWGCDGLLFRCATTAAQHAATTGGTSRDQNRSRSAVFLLHWIIVVTSVASS